MTTSAPQEAILDRKESQPLGAAVLTTEVTDYPLYARGKVRDIYDLGDRLLFVATDRISAFDVVLPTGIPGKGKILTGLSVFWFDFLKKIVPNHFITADAREYPKPLKKYESILAGRSMLVKKVKRIDLECVVRGYIAGSFWKEYVEARKISNAGNIILHGEVLPDNLKESEILPFPIFTPATKADTGHDENISLAEAQKVVASETVLKLREVSLRLFQKAADYAQKRGIIIADTKFEFGRLGSQLILIDEVLTPDSSRFWPAQKYEPGRPQESFDKQYVRDYLEEVKWNKKPPAPPLPQEVVRNTQKKYLDAYQKLTGRNLSLE